MKYLFMFFMAFATLQLSPAYADDPISTGFFSSEAVSGYDTVAYFTEGKPVKGDDEFSVKWNGATWLFSSAENLAKFEEAPEKYAPQYGGYCAWAAAHGALAGSDPEQWHIEDGKLYLNYDKSIKEKWLPRRHELIPVADAEFPGLIE